MSLDLDMGGMIDLIAEIESGGNLYAMGDHGKAYGVLQIQQGCLTDVNKANGTHWKLEDLLGNRELSEWVFREYMKLYATEARLGRPVTAVDMAGIWNGGPNGWRKPLTQAYRDRFVRLANIRGVVIA